MPTIYVARSQTLEEWAEDVGLTKHVFKVGVCEGDPAVACEALNAESHASATDWALLKIVEVEAADEADILARLARREALVDPKYYPRIRGATGIVKVKIANAQNQMMVERAMEGRPTKALKFKPVDVAEYLLRNLIP